MELIKGRVYRAKKPANCNGYYNDRQIVWTGTSSVQYDGPAVRNGQRYPTVSREKFESWAGEDVTEKLPPGDWQRFGV